MNIDRVCAAAARLNGHVRHTPLLTSPALDALAGRRVWVKPECLQHTGSFKARGAWAAISALPEADRARGVTAFSSGNHAQGVARAARAYGVPAVILMPADSPRMKIDNTRALGAEVVLYDRARDDRDALGDRLAAARGLTLIRPFDDPEVIAGQATVGLEIAADLPDDARGDVLVPCGGGGLTSGIALALAAEAPAMRVRPVEPRGFDDVARSLASGRIERNAQTQGGLCDAIITPSPGQLTFPIMARLCGPGLVVSDDEALAAMRLAFAHLKLVAEPGGAVALAAALFHGDALAGEDVVVVISGGNVDAGVFSTALETRNADV